ncbi:MAG TPA: hypothetical protein GX707_18495 [Epulopiscium sp.]|nr:hypothetical protein [Candidatus Epulonipiscium sp.]
MKKTIYMIFLLTGIIAISATMTACSNPVKAENVNLQQEVSKVSQENQALKEEIQQLQQNNQELEDEIVKLDPTRVSGEPDSMEQQGESVFRIYGANIDTYKKELISEKIIKNSLALEEKLKILAEELSKSQFGDQIIEVAKIEDQDGKKIAVINLNENPNTTGTSWKESYFQGSAGGAITAASLEETFLQKEYDGEWIDGVQFLYEHQTIEFDHIGILGEVRYR